MDISVDQSTLIAKLRGEAEAIRTSARDCTDAVVEHMVSAIDFALEGLRSATSTAQAHRVALERAITCEHAAVGRVQRLIDCARTELGASEQLEIESNLVPVGTGSAAAPGVSAVSYALLGSFELRIAGRAIDLRSSCGNRSQSVFEYLLVHHEAAVPRDVLIEAVWPGLYVEDGHRRLHQAMYSLRQMLSAATGNAVRIECTRSAYRVVGDAPATIDVILFEQLANQGRATSQVGDHQQTIDCLTRAAAQYRGNLLESSNAEWVEQPRDRLRRLYVEIAHQLASLLAEHDRCAEAAEHWERLRVFDAWHEGATLGLMRALVELGHPSQALQVYVDWVAVLDRDLGVTPSTEATTLYESVLATAYL